MSLLLDLPEDLTRVLLIEWLECIEYGLVDAAISNKAQRSYFDHLLLELPDVQVAFVVLLRVNVSLYNWIWSKRLKLRNVHLTAFSFEDGELRFNLDCQYIQEISINSKTIPSGMGALVNKCHHLKSLKSNKVQIILKIDCDTLTNLTELNLSERMLHEDAWEVARIVSQWCCDLVHLTLRFGGGLFYSEEYISVLQKNERLESLWLFSNDSILQAVLDYCPSIQDLRLEGDHSSRLIGRAIQQLTSAKVLRIDNVNFTTQTGNLVVEHKHGMQWSDLFAGLSGIQQFSTQSSGNVQLMPSHFQELIHVCGTTLTSLSIVSYDSYSADCIGMILQQCRKLQRLTIKHDGLDDVAAVFAAALPTTLTELRLSCNNIGIESVISILKSCTALVDFIFRGVVEEVALIPAYKALVYDLHASRSSLKGTICFNSLIMNNFINRRVKLIFDFGRFGGVLVDKYLTPQELQWLHTASMNIDENSVD